MTNFQPAASTLQTKRAFSVQMALAITPPIVGYFYDLSDKLVEMHICQNPKITEEEVFAYVGKITPQIHQLIRSHSVTISENLCSDHFNEKIPAQTPDWAKVGIPRTEGSKDSICQ